MGSERDFGVALLYDTAVDVSTTSTCDLLVIRGRGHKRTEHHCCRSQLNTAATAKAGTSPPPRFPECKSVGFMFRREKKSARLRRWRLTTLLGLTMPRRGPPEYSRNGSDVVSNDLTALRLENSQEDSDIRQQQQQQKETAVLHEALKQYDSSACSC